MEIFQSKLKEAEKIASKRKDCGVEQWRKPAYSDRAQYPPTSDISDLVKSKRGSEGRSFATEVASSSSSSSRDSKFSHPDPGKMFGSLETCRRESALRQRHESSGNLKPKFLRPSDEDELSFHSKWRNFEPSASSSTSVAQDTVRDDDFRKPLEKSEETLSSRSLTGRREGDQKHLSQKLLENWSCGSHRDIELLPAESLRDEPHLQDTKSTFAGYFMCIYVDFFFSFIFE